MGPLCSRPQELFLAGPFPGGLHPLGIPGKIAPLLRGWPVGLSPCPEPASPEGPGPQSRPGLTFARCGGSRAPGGLCPLFLPGGSYCRLVGEAAVTGMELRPRVGCSEKARGSSQDQTVQNVLCPAPPWPRPKYPAWLLPSLPLGVTFPALEARPGSTVWGSHREGWQDPVHLAWARPLTCSRPSSKPSWGTFVHLSYSGACGACQVSAGRGGVSPAVGVAVWKRGPRALSCCLRPTACPSAVTP